MDERLKYAGPVRCGALAELVAAGVEQTRVSGVKIGGVVEYALPVGIEGELREYLSGKARANTPTSGLVRLEEARVYGAGVVLSADGTMIARDVAEDFGKAEQEHWLIGLDDLRAPVELTGTTAVVAVNHGAGYCHWLLEELPRLLTLPVGAVDNVIAHSTGAWVREAWALRGSKETLVEARRSTHFSCAPLWVPSLAAWSGAPTPDAVRAVRAFTDGLGRAAGERGGAGDKIYISRSKAARRRVTNEEELWHELEQRGFARVFLEELSWAQQIAAARAARVIVAPHGAGLANLVFCAPGTQVVELVNRMYFNPVFWRLAALGELNYQAVMAPGSEPFSESLTANKKDIVADLSEIRKLLYDNAIV